MVIVPDKDLADQVNAYMREKPYCTRNELRKRFKTSQQRLAALHEAGLITRLPIQLGQKQAAIMGARASNWRTSFKLPGSL